MQAKQLWHTICADPFRIFFPIGTALAVVGALYWPGLWLEIISNYPSRFHILMMIYGFMWAMIQGFITTAVPRLTGSKTLSSTELMLLLSCFSAIIISLWRQQYLLCHLLFFTNIILLLGILGKRLLRSQRSLPPTFVYLPAGFLAALMGTFLSILISIHPFTQAAMLTALASNLVFQGLILFLLLGIGGFLIRSILGWAAPLPTNQGDAMPTFRNAGDVKWHVLAAILILGSFFLEIWAPQAGRLIRAVVSTCVVFLQLKIHRKVISGKLSAYTLQLAMFLLIAGLWGQIFAPAAYRITWLHFTFMGGFSISAFSIATRVILSHCNYSELLQKRYTPFTVSMTLILFGLSSRVAANFFPDAFFSHLSYAAFAWVLGIVIWSSAILSKLMRNTFQQTQAS